MSKTRPCQSIPATKWRIEHVAMPEKQFPIDSF
jgi:hypothetical protein